MTDFGGDYAYDPAGPAGRLNSSLSFDRHVLVIGGAGYIGSVLVRKLLDQGYRVRVLDKLLYNNGISVADLVESEEFSFINGDFGNPATLEKTLEGISDVILLAALVGDPICKKYPDVARQVNLAYPKQLFGMLNGRDIRHFVFTSTCSNYGLRNDDTPADETSDLNPQSLYAETKVAFEQQILGSLGTIDFCPTILRLSTAYGISKRMRFDLSISEFTRDLALGKDLLVYDETTWRPYCHISDISNAIIGVIEARTNEVFGEVFNVGSDGGNYTKKMLVDLILKYIPDAVVNYKQGGFDPRNYRVSFEKIRRILEFETEFTAEDSIRGLIGAVRGNLFPDMEEKRNFYGNYVINE
jgi:nucleoside-diphosphate-sugar epimerase